MLISECTKIPYSKEDSDLKSFHTRYSSFNHTNYSKSFLIPACTLAKYGFHYNQETNCIRCFECGFEYENLQQGLLNKILQKHHQYQKDCSQVRASLIDYLDETSKCTDAKKTDQNKTVFANDFYKDEANRLKSFQKIRLQFDPKTLVLNGLYRVLLSETLKNRDTRNSIIDQLSIHVPSLIHLKCAFCPYECLISKLSSMNTYYKSPIQEHEEKFAKTCQVFQQSVNTDVDHYLDLDWFKCLVQLDKDQVDMDQLIKLNQNNSQMKGDDLIVERIPKAIDQVISFEISKNKKFVYAPNKPVQLNDSFTTSDFTRLQSVLNHSDSVINGNAYHPGFRMHHVRLESFRGWPASLSQQPRDLARAGFYFFGVKDMVKCFFCNGGLKDWTAGDDPYQDHVRWFPKCQFIRQLMGSEYIEKIREKFKNQESGFTDELFDMPTSITKLDEDRTNLHAIEVDQPALAKSSSQVTTFIDTNIMRRIVDANIVSRDLLKQAFAGSEKARDFGVDSSQVTMEITKLALDIGDNVEQRKRQLEQISDFMICELVSCVELKDIKALISFQFGIKPQSVKLLRQYGSFETRCLALVGLERNDKYMVDRIVKELSPKYLLNKSQDSFQVFQTNWSEYGQMTKTLKENNSSLEASLEQCLLSEKLKSKPVDVSSEGVGKLQSVPEVANPTGEKSVQLKEENERLKSERLCVVCLSQDKNVLFLPCAHLASCLDCSFNMQSCPLCRSKIQATVRTYS